MVLPTNLVFYGAGTVAFYQDPLGMYNVTVVRSSWGQVFDLKGYVDGIALNDCDMLGREVWLQRGSGPIIGPFLCVDCASRQHIEWRESRNLIADVGWWTAKMLWGLDTYAPNITIYIEQRGTEYELGRAVKETAKRLW